jgi:hypothetical protein
MVVLAGAMRLRVRRAFYRSVGAILEGKPKPAVSVGTQLTLLCGAAGKLS